MKTLVLLFSMAASPVLAEPRVDFAASIGSSNGFGIAGLEPGVESTIGQVAGPWLWEIRGRFSGSRKVETGDGVKYEVLLSARRQLVSFRHVGGWAGLALRAARQQTSAWSKTALAPQVGGGIAWRSGRAGLWWQAPDSSPNHLELWSFRLKQSLGRGAFCGIEIGTDGRSASSFRILYGWRFGGQRPRRQ